MAEAAGRHHPSLSITVEKNPPEARLLQLGVKSWPKYLSFRFLISLLDILM
jgi:hypothetical protein